MKNHGDAATRLVISIDTQNRGNAFNHSVKRLTETSTGLTRRIDRLTSHIGFATQSFHVSLVSIGHRHINCIARGLVGTVAGPGHPVESSVGVGSIGGFEVGSDEKRHASSRPHRGQIQPIPDERRHEDLIAVGTDLELSRLAAKLLDLGSHVGGLRRLPPIEVEGDEELHPILGSGLVCIAELAVSIVIKTNVQSKGIDPESFGTGHVVIIVGSAGPARYYSNLREARVLFHCDIGVAGRGCIP